MYSISNMGSYMPSNVNINKKVQITPISFYGANLPKISKSLKHPSELQARAARVTRLSAVAQCITTQFPIPFVDNILGLIPVRYMIGKLAKVHRVCEELAKRENGQQLVDTFNQRLAGVTKKSLGAHLVAQLAIDPIEYSLPGPGNMISAGLNFGLTKLFGSHFNDQFGKIARGELNPNDLQAITPGGIKEAYLDKALGRAKNRLRTSKLVPNWAKKRLGEQEKKVAAEIEEAAKKTGS